MRESKLRCSVIIEAIAVGFSHQVERAFENTQWRKVKIWKHTVEKSQHLKRHSGEKSTFENKQWRKVKIWKHRVEKSQKLVSILIQLWERSHSHQINIPTCHWSHCIASNNGSQKYHIWSHHFCQLSIWKHAFVVTCRPLGCIDFPFLRWSDNQFSSDGLITSLPLEKSDNQLADSPLEKIPTVWGARLILEKWDICQWRTIETSSRSSSMRRRSRRRSSRRRRSKWSETVQTKRQLIPCQCSRSTMLLLFLVDADFSFLLHFWLGEATFS